MNAQDKNAFFMAFATLCTAFSRTLDEALVEVYWRALHEAPLANAQDAINHAIMNDEFMPPPAKLRARAGIASRRNNSRSCGQMAIACAARFRTIDSSAICSSCGLRSSTIRSFYIGERTGIKIRRGYRAARIRGTVEVIA